MHAYACLCRQFLLTSTELSILSTQFFFGWLITPRPLVFSCTNKTQTNKQTITHTHTHTYTNNLVCIYPLPPTPKIRWKILYTRFGHSLMHKPAPHHLFCVVFIQIGFRICHPFCRQELILEPWRTGERGSRLLYPPQKINVWI